MEKICSAPSSWMDAVIAPYVGKMRGFDAADSERSARPESPTSPCQLHSIPMPNKNHGKGGKGKEEHHILPKGSVNHGQAAFG